MGDSAAYTQKQIEAARETVRIGLSGAGPTGDHASEAFDRELDEAMDVLEALRDA